MTTFNAPPPKNDLTGMQDKLTARLARLGSRIRAQIALDAAVRGLAIILGLLTLTLVLDYWLELSKALRVMYWLVTLSAGVVLFYRYGLKPLSHKLGPVELAEAVDVAQKHKGAQQLAPRVATVLQLPAMFGNDDALSGQMIHDAVDRSYRSLEQTNFNSAVNSKHVMQCVGALFAALLLPGIVGYAMSHVGEEVLETWAERWIMLKDTAYPRNTSIVVQGLDADGKLVIPAGENFTIRTAISNKDKTDVDEPRLELEPENGKTRTEALASFSENDFRLDMNPLTSPAKATVRAGDQTLSFDIVPVARPRLTGLKLTHTHPADGVATVIDFSEARGEISLLEHNKVELVLTANVPVAEARHAKTENREDQPAPPAIERIDANTFKLTWTHHDKQRLLIELVSKEAKLVSAPIPISIGLKADRKPSVRVRSTGVGPRITPDALIPLSEVKASDDLGLRSMSLRIVRERTGPNADEPVDPIDPIVLFIDDTAEAKEYLGKHDLEVDQFALQPTDVLRVTGVALDNRYFDPSEDPGKTGQEGTATTLTFRIVTHAELFREIITRQQQARAAFRQAIEDCRDIESALKLAETGLEASSQERRFRNIRRDVWKVSNELAKSAEEMRLNRLGGSKEDGNAAYESMKSMILDPLEQLHSGPMDAQQEALRSAANAGGLTPEQLVAEQQALIKKMNDLLLKMDRWDQFLDTVNQLTEVIKYQEQVRDAIKKLMDEQLDDIFDQ